MTSKLVHRGPDAQGAYVDKNVGLGHRRLSIIDLRDIGNQPMFNEDGTVCVVFNGEIYNFQELRKELAKLGHTFRTHTDTEVIVHGWEQWNTECVERLDGMFAFAIYDATKSKLFIARDRLGKKPLYYVQTSNSFAFASELKGLHPIVGKCEAPNPRSLQQFVCYGYSLCPNTIYPNVFQIKPGHYATISTENPLSELHTRPYWTITNAHDHSITESEWLQKVDDSLRNAVRKRLCSDVPLGLFLSGGIDSSIVLAYAARESDHPLRAISIGFHETSHDESNHAAKIAQFFGVHHQVEYVQHDAIALLDELICTYDEPFGDESAIPTYYLCQAMRKHCGVALSGDGGDEVFLGYRRYQLSKRMNAIAPLMTPIGRNTLGFFANQLPLSNRFRRFMQRQSQSGFRLYHHALGFSQDAMAMLHSDIRRALDDSTEAEMEKAFHHGQDIQYLDRCAAVDFFSYLPNDILVKVDRASMRHSLEVRSPLLDIDLIELSAQIPTCYKMRWGDGKLLLRRLLGRHLPAHLIRRSKSGFGIPLAKWFRHDLKYQLQEMLSDQQASLWNWLNRNAIEARFVAHQSGKVNFQSALWRALHLYRWSLAQSTTLQQAAV